MREVSVKADASQAVQMKSSVLGQGLAMRTASQIFRVGMLYGMVLMNKQQLYAILGEGDVTRRVVEKEVLDRRLSKKSILNWPLNTKPSRSGCRRRNRHEEPTTKAEC